MNSTLGLVAHTTSLINESCFVFRKQRRPAVKGLSFSDYFDLTVFSYDGFLFHNHADSKNGHYRISLAKFDQAPLAVGGEASNTNKAEIFNIANNTWTEIAEYPCHD